MATIALYKSKLNQMPSLISTAKTSVSSYNSELFSLKTKVSSLNSGVCNLDEAIQSIQASTQTQEQKITSLENLQQNVDEFIADVVRVDSDVATLVNKNKENFYKEFPYLKPDFEKTGWEKFCEGLKKVGDWCKENWKSIAKILIAVVIIVALGVAMVLTGGTLAVILAGAFWGALAGGLIGGVLGGVASKMSGGSFLDGFADGMLSGAVTGAITGAACAGLGVLGSAFGKTLECGTKLANAIKATSQVTKVLSIGMDGFDLLAMGAGFMFGQDNFLTEFNQKLHSSKLYNGFQIVVNGLAIFTGAANASAKCFIAGTMILTATGLVAIERIKVGDKVVSTNEKTFEVAHKTVLETYVRTATILIVLTIAGEVITTTDEHPFFVKDRGFVYAAELQVGDELLDSKGNVLLVEDSKIDVLENPVAVYNFQVEDFHTYHVGENGVWVHNANCKLIDNGDGTYDAELSYKEDWTPEQRLEADNKLKALSEADTVKTEPNRGGTSASKTYKSKHGADSVKPTQDVDHTHDLQLGGADDVLNMNPLDKSVNRSLGSQIAYLIKDLEIGTVLRNFTIH